MGETHKDALRLDFDRRLKLEFHGTKVTSDGGLLAYWELDDALGLTSSVESQLRDTRTGKNTPHGPAALLRQSVYSRLAGHDNTNDAERLALDPAMPHVAGGRAEAALSGDPWSHRPIESQPRTREGRMPVFARKTPFGDEETGVEVCRESRQILCFFADSRTPATSMAKLTPRTI